jgi:hypothetical protein
MAKRHELRFKIESCGRAMAQAVSRRPPTAETQSIGICGGQSGTGAGFCASTSDFPCHFHSTGVPLLEKMQEKTDHLFFLFIFITRVVQ